MADETKPATGPTEDRPYWVKNPATGEVTSVWRPEDVASAQANGFTNATQEEADKAFVKQQAQGWKGKLAAGVSGVAETVPFAHNIVRSIAPQLGEDVETSDTEHPWIHAGGELVGIAALGGAGGLAERGAAAVGEGVAAKLVGEKVAQLGVEAAAEKGIAKAVPTLAERVLARVPAAAENATLGLEYGGIHLTNEKDLPHDPEKLASHVMSTLFWSTAGGVVGGEAAHQLLKGASAVANASSKVIGKMGDRLEGLAEGLRVDPEKVVNASRSALADGVSAIDGLAKESVIDKGMEAARKKLGDEAMGPLDAMRLRAEDAYEAARGDINRIFGVKGKLSADKLARVLKSDERMDALEALQRFHEAGKQLHAFHEEMAKVGATGLEGFSGKTKEQVDGLLQVQDAVKQGLQKAGEKASIDEVLNAGIVGGVAQHFGHLLLGKAYVAVKAAKLAYKLAPAEFKAAQLSRLAQLADHVEAHLDRVANATVKGGTGRFAAPAASLMSADELEKLRTDVAEKMGNPQKAMDHLHERAGALEEIAPDTYGQMGMQYAAQLQTLAGILQWPELPGVGVLQPKYVPSASERAKLSSHVAIVQDPRVFEAKLAKGTATPAEAAIYKSAHSLRADSLGTRVIAGLNDSRKADKATLKTMTSLMVLGIPPRASYSQPVIAGVQGLYSQRMNQQGGPGSRGGTGGAKALTASQMISLPGQRVANRQPK